MEWKEIPGYKGLYKISENGTVWSSYAGGREKAQQESQGYKRVKLGTKYQSVHRIVCELWNGSGEEGQEVNHKDGNRANNHYQNLEWVSHSENIRHSYQELERSRDREYLKGNKFNSTKTILKREGEQLEFIDKQDASRYLERADNYVNNRLYRGQTTAVGKNGMVWEIVEVEQAWRSQDYKKSKGE